MVKRYSKISIKEGRETVFIETIGYANGNFREDVRRNANAMLNSHGGVIYFGVDSSGMIKGKSICRKEEDDLRLAVDRTLGSFQPFVSSQHYRLSFVWLEEGSYKYIELKVSIGELGEIYEDGTTKVFIIDNAKIIGPLFPQELQELILLKYKQSIEGAEEAAKYCTPNLMRAKTIAKTTKKPPSLEKIVEREETKNKQTPINNKAVVTISKTPSQSTLVKSITPSRNSLNKSVEITLVRPASSKPSSTSSLIPKPISNVTSSTLTYMTSQQKQTTTSLPPKTTSATVVSKTTSTTNSISSSSSSIPKPITSNNKSASSSSRNTPPRSCTLRQSPRIRATVQRTYSIGRTPPPQSSYNSNYLNHPNNNYNNNHNHNHNSNYNNYNSNYNMYNDNIRFERRQQPIRDYNFCGPNRMMPGLDLYTRRRPDVPPLINYNGFF